LLVDSPPPVGSLGIDEANLAFLCSFKGALTMKRLAYVCLCICLNAALVLAMPQSPAGKSQQDTPSAGSKMTIEGLVRDLACPIQNPAAMATKFNLQCALDCAKQGSPLIILKENGEIYFPISGSMPDVDQRQKLMPLVGKYVRATGTVFDRKGTRAIVIEKIEELKDVHLITDAK
jgi:hypothetical protein